MHDPASAHTVLMIGRARTEDRDPRAPLIAADVGGPAALQALIRDGVAIPFWGGTALPADVPATPALRAQALANGLPHDVVLGRQSAVWVHTGSHRPRVVAVLVHPGRHRGLGPRLAVHEATVDPRDVTVVGGVAVTSVLRTAIDVARWTEGPVRDDMLDTLVHAAGLDVGEAVARLGVVRGHRHTVRARAALRAARARATAGRFSPSAEPPSTR